LFVLYYHSKIGMYYGKRFGGNSGVKIVFLFKLQRPTPGKSAGTDECIADGPFPTKSVGLLK